MDVRNRKVLSVLLTLVMMFTLCMPAFAATSDPNMTFVDYSQMTIKLAPGESVTLMAGPATAASYSFSGFDTTTDADALNWVSSNLDLAAVQSVSHGTTADGKIYSAAVITIPSTATIGSCSIEASRTNPASFVNFSIIVDTTVTSEANNVSVYLPDFMADLPAGTIEHNTQNFAAPIDAMNALKAAGVLDYTGGQSYIASITYDGMELAQDIYSEYGWNYRVYRQQGDQHLLVNDSAHLGMDIFQLQDHDVIVWAYNTYAGAVDYFAQDLADLYL